MGILSEPAERVVLTLTQFALSPPSMWLVGFLYAHPWKSTSNGMLAQLSLNLALQGSWR